MGRARAIGRSARTVVGALALVALGAVAFGPALAGAADGDGDPAQGGTEGRRGPWRALTDEQRACLEENGATLPEVPRDENGRPTERPNLTDEQREALRNAAEACGIGRGPGCEKPQDGEPGESEEPAPEPETEGTSTESVVLAV